MSLCLKYWIVPLYKHDKFVNYMSGELYTNRAVSFGKCGRER